MYFKGLDLTSLEMTPFSDYVNTKCLLQDRYPLFQSTKWLSYYFWYNLVIEIGLGKYFLNFID